MKIIRPILLVLLFSISPLSYAQPCNSILSFQWLIGFWVADDGETITVESWKAVSPLTFEGSGETKTKDLSDVVGSEFLRLVEMGDDIFYLAKPNQNDLPVAFKLAHCSGNSATFENLDHDFPKKLEYRLVNEDSLTVIVSGANGNSFTIMFDRRSDGR